jgi:UPF0716 protein FxsA
MRPGFPLAVPLLALLVAEVYTLIRVGGAIGPLATIALLLGAAALGSWLVRRQGTAVLTRQRAAMDRGEMPTGTLLDGAMLLAAGVLLVLPGLLSDGAALLLLVPPLRHWLVRRLGRGSDGGIEPPASPRAGRRVIEGDWRRED